MTTEPQSRPGVGATLASLAALLVLTGLTTALALIDSSVGAKLLVALLIAAVKAALVLAVFMELAWATRLVRAVALAGLTWLLFLLAGVLADLVTRWPD